VTQAAEIAALKATVQAQAREIRDLKVALNVAGEASAEAINALTSKVEAHIASMQPVLVSSTALIKLLEESHRQKGFVDLGKQLAGWGIFGMIGAAAVGIYQFFAAGGFR
jgi:hypothetical protein